MPAEAFTYSDVQQAFRTAAGSSNADYGGAGKFWELPLPAFLGVRLMGLALIEPLKSCCAEASPAGRGARSALVRGLRGEVPFDGTQFVRLPWGGTPVPDEIVDRIAAWIDEGCPGDHSLALEVAGSVVVEEADRIVVTGPPGPAFAPTSDAAAYRHAKGELRQRMDVDAMSPLQIDRLRCAFREMYNLNQWVGDLRNYNNIALIHQNHCQHGWERFLPWHRVYLYEFEQILQDFCPDVTLPYWDFSAPRYSEDPPNGDIIPPAFKAFLTESSLAFLSHAGFPPEAIAGLHSPPSGQAPILGTLYAQPSAFFAAIGAAIGPEYVTGAHRERLIDALLAANSLWYPLRYPAQFPNGITGDPFHYHYPSVTDIEEILSLPTFRDFGGGSLYTDAFGFLDQNPHNTMHIWTGGLNPDAPKETGAGDRNRAVRISGRRFHKRDDLYGEPDTGDMLSNLTASYDPVFWPIHSNIDRLWGLWQQTNPHGLPADLDAVLTPWSYAVRDTLDMHRFGYEYVRGSFVLPVDTASPVGRFVSTPIAVPDAVRKGFRAAEVRLHRVPQLPRSCFIRVFLNVPDADGTTPITHEGYAGYAAVFGHGECYGGPGHCATPEPQGRKYDLRPRSMNTPRNHRVDVSKAVRTILANGGNEVTITLVVIGASYEEDRELLRLDGVSLNFLD